MTGSLPWDRFHPDEEQAVELPYRPHDVPPPVKPNDDLIERVEPVQPTTPPAPVVDWDKLLDGAWPMIKDQLTNYVKGTMAAGFDVDHTHPTITATTVTGKELVVADAKSRSWRTLAQGLIFDVFAAFVGAIAVLSGADPFAKQTWIAFGVLLFKSVVSAVISYFMRLRVTPTMKNEEGEKMRVLPLPVPIPQGDRELFPQDRAA